MSKQENRIAIYESEEGVNLELVLQGDSLWLTQAQMATLFDKDVRTINEHILNIFSDGELLESATIRKSRIVQQEGKRSVKRTVYCTQLRNRIR